MLWGREFFAKEENPEQKLLSIVCHELTHACSYHLDLPTWLNEGLAMVSVDRCLGKPTVLFETLVLLNDADHDHKSANRINLRTQSREDIILLYACGYWLIRYLVETRPGLVNKVLAQKLDPVEIYTRIAAALEISQEYFWGRIDPLVVAHFRLEHT